MPASNTRALTKAAELGADAIIMDLEDSVAPEAKADARNNIVHALRHNDYGRRTVVVRVNALNTEFFESDMALLQQIQPHAVLLPKVESAQDIIDVHQALDAIDHAGVIGLWAMLETTMAVINAVAIAQTKQQHDRFQTVCVGNNDIAREAGMQVSSDRSLMLPWISSLLLAAKAYKLNILDGVFNNFRDTDGFLAECKEGAAMGMNGKTLIHPSQIEIANAAFSPSGDAIAQAQRIVAEFEKPENANAGVVQIDGQMVERLHLSMALETLAVGKRIFKHGVKQDVEQDVEQGKPSP